VGLLTVFRFWFACRYDLIPDEAYYWVWSKHFALSYRDKGPLVAWTIVVGTKLFGDTVFGVRFFAVVLSAGTAYQMYRLARRLYDESTALWCLGVATLLPLFGIGSILMTIDPLSVFFWAWGANLAWSGIETGKVRYWFLVGAAAGLGFLAKFINVVELLCLMIFLGWSRPHRRFLLSWQSFAMLLGFVLCSLPVFVWNIQTGWLHVQVLADRGGLDRALVFKPSEFFKYLGGELGALTPMFLVGMVIAVIALWRKQSHETRVKFLLTQYVPIQLFFLLLSLNSRVQPNWIAPTLVAGIILLVAYWRPLFQCDPKWRRPVWISLGLGLLVMLVLHLASLLPVPAKYDVLHKAEGWADFAQQVQRVRKEHNANLLIANYYNQASMMQFYLPDHPVTYLPQAPYGETEFTLWPGYEVTSGTRALYVVDQNPVLDYRVAKQFKHSRLVHDFWAKFHGRPIERFFIYLLWNE
jgi:4-amino-4-deoxy-L-arabinose transferase-like glycosyltransferase